MRSWEASAEELRKTAVARLQIDECMAKVREGDPDAVDASCLDRTAPAPWFLDFSGPGP